MPRTNAAVEMIFVVWAMCSAGLVWAQASSTVSAQSYPAKPIRIATSPIGGGTDSVARLVAQGLSTLGQPVIVDNRPAVIAGELVSKASPDGYTLLVASGALWIGALLQNVPYDPVRDFAPISMTTRSPNILVVHPSIPAKSVQELVALAKARPGELNYGSAGTGTSPHLAGELFKALSGTSILHIPFKGTAQALTALLGGQIQLIFSSTSAAAPHVTSARLRALAVTSAQPTALVPGLPTVAASGVPGYEMISVDGVFAPARTSGAIIGRLNQELVRFLNSSAMKDQFQNSGSEAEGSSPEEFAAAVKSEMSRLGKLIRDVGIKTD